MLHILDVLLTFVHLAIILFNLFGWIPKQTRNAHLVLVLLTASSWFLLGIGFGMGYCPITEWQWRVKEQLGEKNLPASFITYYANKVTHRNWAPAFINTVTGVSFAAAALLSVYVNFIKRGKKENI